MKVKPVDQLFMTLMRLRLNLKVVDLAFRLLFLPLLYHDMLQLDMLPLSSVV